MLTKSKIALSAVIVLAAASAAFAGSQRTAYLPQFSNESPENKISDRYPGLEQTMPVARTHVASRAIWSGISNLPQFSYETPENKISDRYLNLEQTKPVSKKVVANGRNLKRVSALENMLFARASQNF
ncbi:MAG TPA: hypothetical protein VMH84_11495 [Xanthobacteraceae bacterium]|nr:hypothetical protein [Xanthobacteraceae bacterium]